MEPAGDVVLAVSTAPDADTAERIARVLVEERLAACVNVLPGVASLYRWEGEVREDAESALILKTTASRFEGLRARIRALHSYDLPAILALPAATGDADFLAWVREQAGPG